MPEKTDFTKTLHRLMQAMNASNDAELARALGITPQSISGARKRGEAPPAWIQACAAATGVNAHWLFFGSGPMRLPQAGDGELPSMHGDCEADLIHVPLAEARQLGTVILASDCPFCHEVLEGYENAYYFHPFREEELAELMEQVICGKIKPKEIKKEKEGKEGQEKQRKSRIKKGKVG